LPETERFAQLKTEKKHFIDTIKLIAYRAESALTGEIREALARDDDCRVLLRRLFVTPANLRPDPVAQTLTVETPPPRQLLARPRRRALLPVSDRVRNPFPDHKPPPDFPPSSMREDAGDYLSARQRCLALFKRTRCRSVRFPR
jgi:hypothetical protein